jgi:hypothetical protein
MVILTVGRTIQEDGTPSGPSVMSQLVNEKYIYNSEVFDNLGADTIYNDETSYDANGHTVADQYGTHVLPLTPQLLARFTFHANLALGLIQQDINSHAQR